MISDEDFRFLLDVSRGATKILEIGTGTGKSTAALALCGARLHTIDKDDIFVYNGLNARRYNCTSNEWWKSTDHANFDFLFIDGQLNDIDCDEILKRTTNNFKVVFHDYIGGENHRDKNKTFNNKGVFNLELLMKKALINYDIQEQLGGTHCILLEFKKDK